VDHFVTSKQSGNWLHYDNVGPEPLACFEVEELASALDDLLNDRICEREEWHCIEPDFSFVVHPQKTSRSGSEIRDIGLEWRILFWNGYPIASFISVVFDRENIEYLRTYLQFVMGDLAVNSPPVKLLRQKGILLDE
jgi:hypothetical protein